MFHWGRHLRMYRCEADTACSKEITWIFEGRGYTDTEQEGIKNKSELTVLRLKNNTKSIV